MAYNVELAAKRGNPRAIARLAGEVMYTPDKPCPRGHTSQRYTKYGQCRDCTQLFQRAARASGKYKAQTQAYGKAYWERNGLQLRLKQYGLTVEQFEALLAEQGDKCKICRRDLQQGRKTHIDHCHESGVVRGVLCHSCNVGLGHFRHSPELLKLAAEYLA